MRVSYLLRAWGHYERDHEYLADRERHNAAVLFQALNKLPPGQVRILAEKYHTGHTCKEVNPVGQHPTDIPLTDDALSLAHHLTIAQYGNMRRRIERRLSGLLIHYRQSTDDTKRQRLTDYALVSTANYYVKEERGYPFSDLVLTALPSMAKVFHGHNELEHAGFTKLSLEELKQRRDKEKKVT